MTEVDPPYLYPDYRSTVARAPSRPLLPLPEELHALAAPVFGEDAVDPGDADLTTRHSGQPLGERIIVTGRVLDDDGRPVADGVVGELSRPGAEPELKEEYRELQARKQAMKLRLKGDMD